MTSNLTEEQTEIFQFARTGHNLLITGQAGTGKSWVVNTIREDCKQRGQKVALVCSSGIACQVYERGIAATAHSYYGLGAADMPSENLIARAVSDKRVRERLHQVDVIIWDEASMSSARMLELANSLSWENICNYGPFQTLLILATLCLRQTCLSTQCHIDSSSLNCYANRKVTNNS